MEQSYVFPSICILQSLLLPEKFVKGLNDHIKRTRIVSMSAIGKLARPFLVGP